MTPPTPERPTVRYIDENSPGARVGRLRTRFMAQIRAVYIEAGGVLRLHLDDGSVWLASADDTLTHVAGDPV